MSPRLFLRVLILSMSISLFFSCSTSDHFIASDGVLDLQNYEFNEHINLDGEWKFIWYGDSSSQIDTHTTQILIDVPDAWNGYEYAGEKINGHGAGSYYLTLLLPDKPVVYALESPTVGTAYNIFINDSLIGGVGIYSHSSSLASAVYETRIYDLGIQSKVLHLRIDVSNYDHRLGGLWESFSLGQEAEIHTNRENKMARELFLFGAIFVMGIYHIGVFSLSTRGKAALYFGIFCLIIGIRTLTTGEVYMHQLWPALPWQILVKLEYLSFYLGIPVFFLFIRLQFPDELASRAVNIVSGVSALFALLVVFTSVDVFSASLIYFQPFSLIAMLYVVYGLGLAFIRGEEGSSMVLVGFMSIVVAFVNDILYVNNFIHTGHLISWGLLIFILTQAFLISMRFAKAYFTIETQRTKLERTNSAYQSEIEIRKAAELEVLTHKNHLEELVTERTAELEKANKQLKILSRVDGLTGIANRRQLDEELDREWKRTLRQNHALSVIMCDIDHFKLYNDTYGHQQGDICLTKVATAISKSVNRPGDLVARYGGEEFCVILPHTDQQGAMQIAEAIRKNVRGLALEHSSSKVAPVVTLSLGVACVYPDRDSKPSLLVEAADRALYQAKGNGRDRVEANIT